MADCGTHRYCLRSRGLAGSPEEVEKGTRLDLVKTGKIQSEMSATLALLSSVAGEDGRDMRKYAYRLVTQHLAARGLPKTAKVLAMAAPMDEKGEILAVVGLELLALRQREAAEEMANAASVSQHDGASSLVALWLALGDPAADANQKKHALDQAAKIAPLPNNLTPTPAARVGYAEGWTRQGNLEVARKLATGSGPPEDRLPAERLLPVPWSIRSRTMWPISKSALRWSKAKSKGNPFHRG